MVQTEVGDVEKSKIGEWVSEQEAERGENNQAEKWKPFEREFSRWKLLAMAG